MISATGGPSVGRFVYFRVRLRAVIPSLVLKQGRVCATPLDSIMLPNRPMPKGKGGQVGEDQHVERIEPEVLLGSDGVLQAVHGHIA